MKFNLLWLYLKLLNRTIQESTILEVDANKVKFKQKFKRCVYLCVCFVRRLNSHQINKNETLSKFFKCYLIGNNFKIKDLSRERERES